MAVNWLGVIPPVLSVVQLTAPEPLVTRVCPFVPSVDGNVNVFDIVTLLLLLIFNAGVVLELLPV